MTRGTSSTKSTPTDSGLAVKTGWLDADPATSQDDPTDYRFAAVADVLEIYFGGKGCPIKRRASGG